MNMWRLAGPGRDRSAPLKERSTVVGGWERKLKLGQWAITQRPEKCLRVMAIEQTAPKKG